MTATTASKPMAVWKKVLLSVFALGVVVLAVLIYVGYHAALRIEPYVREQTALFLRQRFDSEVEIGEFKVGLSLPVTWPPSWPIDWEAVRSLIMERGRGGRVAIDIHRIELRHKGRRDIAPLLAMKRLSFTVNVEDIQREPPRVHRVVIDGLDINIPPKGERPSVSRKVNERVEPPKLVGAELPAPLVKTPELIVDQVVVSNATLKLLPRNQLKPPLDFDIQRLVLNGAGPGLPFKYEASLTNAKPPGKVETKGEFGPWNAEEPGESALEGVYDFRDADLGVFKGIAGTLDSTGSFHGQLNNLVADGETHTPNFRLTSSGNAMPLHTKFHALIDGTNGDTELAPVEALLGKTKFTAKGKVDRDPKDPARSILFDVLMKDGRVDDVLKLAMRGDRPMLSGGMNLDMRLHIMPVKGELPDRLKLDGTFELMQAAFSSPTVQQKIDELSRKGQGRPSDKAISNVASNFYGDFKLDQGTFNLRNLEFDVPGALVQLAGNYLFKTEEIDFHGELRLQARLSKTQTGWKRIVLTPVDPFFAKDGAGTLLKIQVVGTRSSPQFGLDKSKAEPRPKGSGS
jgi:hypothetical protein